MEIRYEGSNKIRRVINDTAELIFTLYLIGGCAYNLATKTGHVSADRATGISQPTDLEKALINLIPNK